MKSIAALLTVFAFLALASADNWPAWRGATGQGYCAEKNLPMKWNKTENIKWKTPLDVPGNSTPVIWGDKIFMTQANKGGTVRGIRCYDRNTGKELWKHDVKYDDAERNWNPNWYCNASPVTDGERVIACYASAGLYCYDFAGKELWKRTDLGKWEHQYGNGSSPILYGDLAIMWCGPNEKVGRNFLLAVNKRTGQTVWEHDEKGGSWGTPLIINHNGKDQMLLGMPMKLKGFDPKTGKELWFCDGLTQLVYTSPLYSNGIAVAMSGYGGSALAVKLGGMGDITKDRLWHHPKNIQRVGSGIIIGEHIYMVEETGVPHCYELATGKEIWEEQVKMGKRPEATTWSSMVHSDNKLYLINKSGNTHIFAASPKYELLAVNRLDDPTYASIAVCNGALFIRTNKFLWCVSEKK